MSGGYFNHMQFNIKLIYEFMKVVLNRQGKEMSIHRKKILSNISTPLVIIFSEF